MTFVPPQLKAPKHPKFDAIHRALMTGLLSNVGNKGDGHEYAGARGIRFAVFPGSGLFEKKPKWVMAAELVETTKLYARTCAEVQPRWMETVGAHLVERTYSEARWDARTQSVMAYERVSLYGLVLAAQRSVHYGPINPKISRELFIHHALVLEELRSEAAFFRHNRALTLEVRGLEAKVRAHNLLADAATRFAFYEARVPQAVTNGAKFEAWRRELERQGPAKARLLYMNKEDLLRADAPEITSANYPDKEEVFGMKLPLEYKFEPGQVNDGVTLTVPIAALSQLRGEKYEWMVPGMLEEKVMGLMRGLPGALRRNFVPVPEFAKAAVKGMSGHEADGLPLAEALAKELGKMTGAEVRAGDFGKGSEGLPDYLKMAFRVVDDGGKTVALSRDLAGLQKKLARESSHAFAQLPKQEFNREGVVSWDFGDLPDAVKVQRFKMMIDAYPALTEVSSVQFPVSSQKEGVALRLFPNGVTALEQHRAGLRRLFMIEQRREIKAMMGMMHLGLEKMALLYRPMGTGEELRAELVMRIVDRALIGDGELIRTRAAWEERKRAAVEKLIEVGDKVTALIGDILALRHELALKTEEAGGAWPISLGDVHDQLVDLMPAGFLVSTPWRWFEEYPRYLRGILARLEKLSNGNYERDVGYTHEISPWWAAYEARREQHRGAGIHDLELDVMRWMLEEFRVHLFAQELRTSIQVSARRLEKQWEKVRA